MNDAAPPLSRWLGTVAMLLVSSACAIAPQYHRPEAPVPPRFGEALPEGWTHAEPSDDVLRGNWWSMYHDPGLDALEESVRISNQNVLAAEAQYRAARAAVKVTRASEFPNVTAAPSVTRAGTGRAANTTYAMSIDAAYQADIWGGIRRSVIANSALAQASAAQLESARLSYQAQLAADYFQIQGLDAERQLLQLTVTSYEEYVQLTEDRFQGCVASMVDVAQARTQLETVRAQLADLEIGRAQFAHAIAVLTGRPPSALTIPTSGSQMPPPSVPTGLPANLLERRADIAAAERQVAAANEQIGVARSARFPTLTLGGSTGTQAAALVSLLSVPTRVWSVGAQMAATLFDGGKARAQVRLSEAAYDATVAEYRQSVLTAMQQVEDSLAQLRILAEEATVVGRAIAAAQQSLNISTIQYRGGLTNYLQVITAQTILLQNQRSAVDLLTRRMLASVALIESLGGGWDVAQLPSANEVRQ